MPPVDGYQTPRQAALAPGVGGSARLALRQPMIGAGFEQVLAAARTGAEWAWTELYKGFAPAILGYLRAQAVPEPEDLTAEVFFQVVRSLGSFDGNEPEFRSWIFVIAHRKIIDDHRSRKRRPVEPSPFEAIERRATTGNVEEEALRGLSDQQVRHLLAGLTPDQRDVLLLRILGGMSAPEVATAMGRRTGAVEALQRRALARLRKRLEAERSPP